jgi:hypothetical protein
MLQFKLACFSIFVDILLMPEVIHSRKKNLCPPLSAFGVITFPFWINGVSFTLCFVSLFNLIFLGL